MKKILSLSLALIMLASVAFTVSCKKEEAEETETQTMAEVNTEDPSVMLGVPEDVDYGNKEFNILGCANWGVDEFSSDSSDAGDIVDSSIVSRDIYIKEYLGVKLNINRIGTGAQFDSRKEFATTVENSVAAGSSGAYDMVASYSMVAPVLATKGLLVDMQTTKYFDDSKAWWPVYMSDVCTVNGKTYHISGDASVNLLYYLQGVLFDAQQMAAHQISEEDIYSLVKDGGWTLETMLEFSKGISNNTDSTWDDSDFYAIGMESAVMLDSFYFALGQSTVVEENGVIKVSDDILSEKTLDIYNLVYQAVYTNSEMRIPVTGNIVNLLKHGRCVFNISTIYQMKTTLAEVENIGVLPFPKYDVGDDEANMGYRTLVSAPHTQFSIPINAPDADMSSAVLETMGYASYTTVTPAVFDNVMKYRYSKDTSSSEMFDILRAGAMTEMGILWTDSFTRYPQSMFRNSIERGDTSWVSNYKQNYEADMKNAVINLNKFYMQ